MPGKVEVPSTLSGHAAEIWRSTFLSAYDGTCKDRSDRDACAAKIAWASVKRKFKKGKDGQWVSKASDPAVGPVSPVVDPGGPTIIGTDVPADGYKGTQAQKWRAAFIKALQGECRNSDKPVECARAKANAAVGEIQERTYMDYKDYSAEYVERREFSTETRKEMAEAGEAMPDGSFPIETNEDVEIALRSLGRTDKPRDEVVAHIRKRAKALGCETTPVLKERFDAWDRYLKRSDLREKANQQDMGLIERMGDQRIVRPDRFSNMDWNVMPPSEKTVGAEARRRIIERNYAQAVEDAQMLGGWNANINHYNMAEYIFSKHVETDAGAVLVRSILVRRPDELVWKLKPVSTFASGSLAAKTAPDEIRHNEKYYD